MHGITLSSIEILISKALIDLLINNDDFVLINERRNQKFKDLIVLWT